ncbi:hypothetical protein HBI56_089050 [Parastagonospora nodorum]|nr:hypothetical protein HBH56_110410 [Parastagonospora nodorum]KAH3925560.1 hypothetical protein HBH54_179930 [Parastagonospora nodorum]KAH3951210.1 hypothetical protein HBH53_066110 [Parastagonospora nodorum]KAH3974365.1 hypothetical protein HBH51_092130 [Parastagonospora nodorum]KAH3978978.1 hypothetical protein HBH52_100120 [Parastagonospora nodorum]
MRCGYDPVSTSTSSTTFAYSSPTRFLHDSDLSFIPAKTPNMSPAILSQYCSITACPAASSELNPQFYTVQRP